VGSKPYAAGQARDGSLERGFSGGAGRDGGPAGHRAWPYTGIAPDGLAIPAGCPAPGRHGTIQSGGNTITPVDTVAAVGYVGITAIHLKIDSSLPSSTDAALTVTVNGFQSTRCCCPLSEARGAPR